MSEGTWRCVCGTDHDGEQCPACGWTMRESRELAMLQNTAQQQGIEALTDGQCARIDELRARADACAAAETGPKQRPARVLSGEQAQEAVARINAGAERQRELEEQRGGWPPLAFLRQQQEGYIQKGDALCIEGYAYDIVHVLKRGRVQLKCRGKLKPREEVRT